MNKRIGIVGGGQLGRMITIEAKRLGFDVTVIDPTPHSPAAQVGANQIIADYNDEKAIKEIGKTCDFLTFEIELANASILNELEKKGLKINPSSKTLTMIKDKLEQKKFLKKVGIPVSDFLEVQTKADIEKAAERFGYPIVLKARFDAYDGRGNALIKSKNQIDKGLEKLQGRKLYVEKFVPFVKELAVMMARNSKGVIAAYPVVETVHKNNICHIVTAPAPADEKIIKQAQRFATKVMKHLQGAGVFGIEMFLTNSASSGKAKIYVNEIAPRVHNSGHYTIEACVTNQFEQHVRAITGLPLGDTSMQTPSAVMINILGERNGTVDIQGLEQVLQLKGLGVHIYGKAQTKIERKMGHITAIGQTTKQAYNKAMKARKLLEI